MRIVDRYLGGAVLKSFLLVAVSLVALMSLSDLVREVDDLGKGRYGFADALLYVLLTMPERALDLAPISALVGCILGLGGLAARNEILMMRAAGMSPLRLCGSALLAGLPLAIGVAALAEYGAPPLSQDADLRRRVAISKVEGVVTKRALWLQEERTIVRIGTVRSGGLPTDLQVFRFSERGQLVEVLRAARATVGTDGRWVLLDVELLDVTNEVPPKRRPSYRLDEGMGDWDLDLLLTEARSLSISDLFRRVGEADAAEAEELEPVLWGKLTAPFLTLAMCLLGVPFVLGQGAGSALGRRIVVGALVGVIAYLLVQVMGYLGVILELEPGVVAVAPVAATLLVSFGLLVRHY